MYRIKVHQGDITKLKVDAIVNAANTSLAGGGGVDGAIHRAAGEELGAACKKIGGCPTGEVRVTPGYKLPAKTIVHAVGPVWQGGEHEEEELLASCYRSVMNIAKQNGFTSIAIPAISCGAYGFPARKAAKIAVNEVDNALKKNPLIESVVFCCFDPVTTALYRSQLGK